MASYGGDIGVSECFSALAGKERCALVDVRTREEWAFVGVPDQAAFPQPLLKCEWLRFGEAAPRATFVSELEAMLTERGIKREDPLFFLCRSGVRSKGAAISMTERGWQRCYNVTGGFEGDKDAHRHRGTVGGWKYQGLPWVQE